MRCKKHITDGSSRIGVCASCLRERLFILVEAQARSAALLQPQINREEDQQQQLHRKSDPVHYHSQPQPPPPLIFPRSVSPYICRRSDNNSINNTDSNWHSNQNSRFYSTPQLGPTTINNDTANTTITSSSSTHHHPKKKNRFSLISNLFRSSHKSVVVIDEQSPPQPPPEPPQFPIHPDPPSTISRASLSAPSPISSSSAWYSSLIPNRKKTTQESPSRSSNRNRRGHHRSKGLSPNYTEDEEEHIGEEDINNIGYISESSPGWRKSTTNTPGRQRKGQNWNNPKSGGGGVSSMAFCLSPLVRASPKRSSHRNQKGGELQTGFSGEIRVTSSVHHNNPNLSTASSFCANRSRKLANFGRYNNYNNP